MHEELDDGALPFQQRHCIYKAVAGLAEDIKAQHEAEPSAGTLLTCLAPLCTVPLFHQAREALSEELVPLLAAPAQVHFI